jgi:hypothetical protein
MHEGIFAFGAPFRGFKNPKLFSAIPQAIKVWILCQKFLNDFHGTTKTTIFCHQRSKLPSSHRKDENKKRRQETLDHSKLSSHEEDI